MDIRQFTPDDAETVGAVVALDNAVNAVDAPFLHPMTPAVLTGMLRHGWDGEVPVTYAAWESDRLVGRVTVHTSEWDNLHLAWTGVCVHPELRRAGRGSELLGFAEDRVRELGRTSIGCDGWDLPGTHGFAERHGLPRRGAAINRRQTLAKVDRARVGALYDDALAHAGAYELVRITGRTPEHLLDAVAEMTAAINDAPTDDLDLEDEVFPTERIVAYERAQELRGRRMYRVVARHKETGALAGHTVVAVESERPWIGDQHDTAVVRAHRGHRLGLLLKADMMRWLADEEPALETVDTWNMESNDHMIGVNEALGYEALGREYQFQRDVR
ncbi:GNAT family N-acetyltransferase [Nocardioides sp. WL0053]|uniref:GNAT family N-acetyltransferase n=1 Tax=Nocardioides jiangsuensis TaxID=2866161 RepID=A0ABS7RES9_9ACTN|nr:GNAT family N-acetyltransferase [Nocardioides jiangsuensis]MBY9073535.1 GNAT family N-acetyltransferase [Nocardioides jiangsuensis]